MKKRRNSFEIMLDMLVAIRKKRWIKITHLMYKANLSHALLKIYIEKMLKLKLIEVGARKTNKKCFKIVVITKKGLNTIKSIEENDVVQMLMK